MKRSWFRSVLALTSIGCVAFSSPFALAQDGPSVRLSLAACPELAADRVRNILDAELGGAMLAEDDTFSTAVEVTLTCEAGLAKIAVVDASLGSSLERRVALDVVHPIARERLVALAIAELLTDLGAELEPPAPVAEPEPPALEPEPEPEPTVTESPPAVTRSISAFVLATTLGSPVREAFGGGARLDVLNDRFGVAASIEGGRARAETDVGDVTAAEVAASIEGLVALRRPRVVVAGALGARLGLAVLRGHASRPDFSGSTYRAPLLAPHLAIRTFVHPTPRIIVLIGVEVACFAVAAHGLVADTRAVSFRGPSLALQLGVGLDLGSRRRE